MTTEEAINVLEDGEWWKWCDVPPVKDDKDAEIFYVALNMAISALRAQQTTTKLDRSRWDGCEMCHTDWTPEDWGEGGAHDFRVDGDALFYCDEKYGWEGIKIRYCPFCGKPHAEEAWAELEKREENNPI